MSTHIRGRSPMHIMSSMPICSGTGWDEGQCASCPQSSENTVAHDDSIC